MGKAGKWLRSFLGNSKKEKDGKEKDKESQSVAIVDSQSVSSSSTSQTPKEKRRWSFRRSVHRDSNSGDSVPTAAAPATNSVSVMSFCESEEEQRKHAIAVAAATAAAADAAIMAAQAAAAVVGFTYTPHKTTPAEEMAALKIQSAFRSHLARKALRALKGLVKLQALARGHLVRKQAADTLRCMQALVTVQTRARAQRIHLITAEESTPTPPAVQIPQRLSIHRRSLHEQHHHRFRRCDIERGTEDNVKIVEMDIGESRGNSMGKMSSVNISEQQMFSMNRRSLSAIPKSESSPSPASMSTTVNTDRSPEAGGGHVDEWSFGTKQISPLCFSAISRPHTSKGSSMGGGHGIEYAESVCNDYTSFPNYMANTESSRAKTRSQSAPRQRPDSYERTPPSRRRAAVESRSVPPRAIRMQRSSSQVGSTTKSVYPFQYPSAMRLDRSATSLKDLSECGSTCSVLSNANYCGRFSVAMEAYSNRNSFPPPSYPL